MLFSRHKLDLSALKSRAVIDAVRCVEVFCGVPVEVLSIKKKQPTVHFGTFGARAKLVFEVLSTAGLYTVELCLDSNRKGSWCLDSGWMTYGKDRYMLRGHCGGYPSHSPELMVDVVSVVIIGIKGKVDRAIFGTSWAHRIFWDQLSSHDDVIEGALFELLRSKS